MKDEYTHPVGNLIYVEENIPGPAEENGEYIELLNNFNSQLTRKCQCENLCTEAKCACVNNSKGANYLRVSVNNTSFIKLNNKDIDFKTCHILECNDLCSCSERCGNRVVQNGPIDGLYVKTCEINAKGVGLFTKTLLPENTFVCEYAGELLTRQQALFRHQKNILKGKMNFIFCLKEHANEQVTQTYVDPSIFGNIGRYINHSCEPNCHILPVRVNSPTPKLALFTLSDIVPDQEITMSYGSSSWLISHSTSYDVEKRKQCFCNTNKCNGYLPYE